jgi:Kef-type K+ transport system membrane component KefB
MNSTIYFAAAALLLFAAGLSAGRKVHRQLTRPKLLVIIAAVTLLTLATIFLLLKLFGRKEGEPPRQPPDYSAATGSG